MKIRKILAAALCAVLAVLCFASCGNKGIGIHHAEITVKDIVEKCGMNRNTFYYHFKDIPTLLEVIIEEDAQVIIKEQSQPRSLEDCLEKAISFALEHKNAVRNIYSSVNRSIFEQSLWRVSEHVVSLYIDTIENSEKLSDGDRFIVVQYLKAVLFGLVSLWLESSMDEKILFELHEIAALKKGDLVDLIRKSSLR